MKTQMLLSRMFQHKTKSLLLLYFALLYSTSLGLGMHPEEPCGLNNEETTYFETALICAEEVLSDIKRYQKPSDVHLSQTIDYHARLQEIAFLQLPEVYHATALDIINKEHGLDPLALGCSHTISTYACQHVFLQAAKLLTAATLHYFKHTLLALGMMLIPPEYLSPDGPQKLLYCQDLWNKNGLTTSDAEAINRKMYALAETPFFSAAVLKMKYDELAQLPWKNADTWSSREWRHVDQIILKIKILLTNLHEQLLGNVQESLYTNRLSALSLNEQ